MVLRVHHGDTRVGGDGVDHGGEASGLDEAESLCVGDVAGDAVVLPDDVRRPEFRDVRLVRGPHGADRPAVGLHLVVSRHPVGAGQRRWRTGTELGAAREDEGAHVCGPRGLRCRERGRQAVHARTGCERRDERGSASAIEREAAAVPAGDHGLPS